MIGLPLTLVNTAGARLVILARLTYWLPVLALIDLVVNVAVDAILFSVLGPNGIPIATVLMRAVAAASYVVLLRASVLPVIAADSKRSHDDARI
jgi:Na+-driven multidrug efflux pump